MSSTNTHSTIGMIGTGTMGAAMVRRLLQAGHDVYIYDRRRSVMDDLQCDGATPVDSVTELTKHCRLILTSLPGPAELEEVSDELLNFLRTLNWYLDTLGMIVSDFQYMPGQRERGPALAFIRCGGGGPSADSSPGSVLWRSVLGAGVDSPGPSTTTTPTPSKPPPDSCSTASATNHSGEPEIAHDLTLPSRPGG